jgi:DNA mismatch repair protein MutS
MATFRLQWSLLGCVFSRPQRLMANDSYQPQFNALVVKSMTPLSQDHADQAPPSAATAAGDRARARAHPVRNRGASPMGFCSILVEGSLNRNREQPTGTPEFFQDLNLDQIVDAITAGRDEYDLKPFFYMHLTDLSEITYRHEVMRDLEDGILFERIKWFSGQIRRVREHLAIVAKVSYKYEKEGWFLEAAGIYCSAVEKLLRDLYECDPKSRGLLGFRTYLGQYVGSGDFRSLFDEAKRLKSELSAIRYCLLINGNSVTVRNYGSEIDYSASVEDTFAKFKEGAVKDYRVKFSSSTEMNQVEGMVLERVALLNPDVFRALDDYCTKNTIFLDKTIVDFDREIQFYVAWLEYEGIFKHAGLKFCYPKVSDTRKAVSSRESFDLALAGKLIQENSAVVCNDFTLSGKERILVVTGPNQGGKTTFARMFGQLHYLASLGCPVPGSDAQFFLFDKLFTHFEREEDVTTLRGKLEDDLIRIHHDLEQATPDSVLIINEIFSSTTLNDAIHLSRRIMEQISRLDAISVCVTFLDELASLNEKTVSMVAGVVPENPTVRTYKIKRRPADGLSYAHAMAEKYRLTYQQLKGRIRS